MGGGLEWRGSALTRLYNGGIFLLYTRTAQIVIAATALIGLIVFIMSLGRVEAVIKDITKATY